MEMKQHIWRIWAQNLHRWGLRDVAVAFLEASAPLNLVLAQGVYLLQPLFTTPVSRNHLEILAGVLENTEETQRFTTYLQEGSLT
jgi:hypothetical protein